MSAVKGFISFFASGVVVKLVGLVGQYLLGWWLDPGDFALYALALSSYSLATLLKGGGSAALLVQRGGEFARLAPVVFQFALLFDGAACVFLAGMAPLAVAKFQAPDLGVILLCLALAFPFSTPSLVFNAKLAIDQRFTTIARNNLCVMLVRQTSMLSMAYLGFGAMALALPTALDALAGTVLSALSVRYWPGGKTLSWTQFKDIFIHTRWVMIGTLVVALAGQADYFIVALFENKAAVGTYFFGFQFALSIAQIIVNSLEAIGMPRLARLADKPVEQRDFLAAAVGNGFLIAYPLGVMGSYLIGPAMHLIWGGKWDAATHVSALVFLNLPMWMAAIWSRAYLEARGWWRARLFYLSLYGIPGLMAVAMGAYLGGIDEVALFYCAYLTVFGFVQLLWLASVAKIRYGRLLIPACKAGFCAAVPYACLTYIYPDIAIDPYEVEFLIHSAIFLGLSIVLLYCLICSNEIRGLARHINR